jgi:hypothetical protein
MKKTGLAVVFIISLLSGCISDSENSQAIFERDLRLIEEYIQQNPIASVKEFEDPSFGIRVFWQELSGSEKRAVPGDTLLADYTGRFLNNSVFDTSIESVARENNVFDPARPYGPLEMVFGIGDVLPGFEFAIALMDVGDKATVIMPSLYGYGAGERQGIPRNSVLIFEIDFISIKEPIEDDLNDE